MLGVAWIAAVNPLSAVSWVWRAWRGRSITFAVLFALGILGFSAMGEFRHVLRGVGAPWYVWLVVPAFVVFRLSRREIQWVPDPEKRRQWAIGIVVGSIVLSLLIAKVRTAMHDRSQDPWQSRSEPGSGPARSPGR